MMDFAELERLDLAAPSASGKLDELLAEVAGFAEARSAAEIAQILQQRLTQQPQAAAVIQPFLEKLRALAFPLLTEEEALALFDHTAAIIADERVGFYERVRARLLLLPETRRAGFLSKARERLRASNEPVGTTSGSTIGAWVSRYEGVRGDAAKLFATGVFTQLDDASDHAVRHLVHLLTLLQDTTPVAAVLKPRRVEPVPTAAPPANLPVAPESVPRPSPPAPVASRPSTPTVAAVIARLHQFETADAKTPATVAHLTPEDEAEIDGHVTKLASLDVAPNVHAAVGGTIDDLIAREGLTFTDENFRRRFTTVMTACLKGIRTGRDTLELLMRPVKVGGLAYDAALAQRLVDDAAAMAGKFHDPGEVEKLMARERQRLAEPMPKPPHVPPEPTPPPLLPVAPRPAPAPLRVSPAQVASTPRPAPPPPLTPLGTAALRPTTAERPTVSDIRPTPRLTGPTEELRQMTLADFRRLGTDTVSSVRRVYEKIQRLGQESFTKKAEGIRAWRESETYQLYLAMGRESLLSSKSIVEVMRGQQAAGQPALSEDEFMLVADLNRKLRF